MSPVTLGCALQACVFGDPDLVHVEYINPFPFIALGMGFLFLENLMQN